MSPVIKPPLEVCDVGKHVLLGRRHGHRPPVVVVDVHVGWFDPNRVEVTKERAPKSFLAE